MKENKPLVSICVPTFNRAEKLQRAIDSILKGSYKNIEIIISDNGSLDQTQNICSHLSKLHHVISYYRHPENLGPQYNFEFARQMAKGQYFMWLSDDDYLDIEYIKSCVNELERDSSLMVASGLGAYYNNNGKLDHYGNVIDCESNSSVLRILKYIWMVGENSIFYGVYRREKVEDLKIKNILAIDWAWMIGVLLKGKSKIIPSLYIHREFETSQSSSVKKIISTLNLPRWNNWLPWTAVCINIAKYIRVDTNEYSGDLSIRKKINYSFIFIILFIKCSLMSIRSNLSKVPFMKKIYIKFFKKKIIA